MNNPIGWFEIYVEDMARARAFYERLFNVKLSRLDSPGMEMWAFPVNPQGQGATGSLVRMPGFAAGANSVLVYFTCADCAVEAAKAARLGGSIQKEKVPIGPYGYIALILDTEGNLIGLHSAR